MARKGPRDLRPEERELWQRIARSADPLRPARAVTPRPSPPKPQQKPQPDAAPAPDPIQPFRVGANAATRIPDRPVAPAPIRMDRKTFTRMSKGRLDPDARIDLHGMTAARAQTALSAFLLSAFSRGDRLVLVITGKGRPRRSPGPMPDEERVLKREVPHWLTMPPLSAVVLDVATAHRRHGGSGAYYVYLRRPR